MEDSRWDIGTHSSFRRLTQVLLSLRSSFHLSFHSIELPLQCSIRLDYGQQLHSNLHFLFFFPPGIERTAPTIAAAPPGPQLILNQKPEESACMEPFIEVAPSEDNYSSEEELKEIINEQKLKDGATSRSLKKV